jgi:hypothetical protein
MSLVRAKLFCDGFKAFGVGAHEAEVSYLEILKFKEKNIRFLNGLRTIRNQIKYEGEQFDKAYAEKTIKF